MTDRLWRVSGLDGRSHAFRPHGGFVPPVYRWVPGYGRLEYRVTRCGIAVPAAFVLTHPHIHPACPRCHLIAQASRGHAPRTEGRTA